MAPKRSPRSQVPPFFAISWLLLPTNILEKSTPNAASSLNAKRQSKREQFCQMVRNPSHPSSGRCPKWLRVQAPQNIAVTRRNSTGSQPYSRLYQEGEVGGGPGFKFLLHSHCQQASSLQKMGYILLGVSSLCSGGAQPRKCDGECPP